MVVSSESNCLPTSLRQCWELGDRDDHAPRFHWMLDQLMGACYLIERNDLGDVQPLPPRLKCPIDVASRVDLCLGWHIVATDEEESGVHKYKLPDRSFRHRRVGSVGRDGTSLRQHFRISLDVRPESDFHNVIDSIGNQSPDSFRQLITSEQNLIRPGSRSDFLVVLGAARGDDSCSRSMRQLNGASSDRTSTALHKNGLALDRTRDVNRPMSRYAGNAETRTLFQRRAFR